MVDELETGPLNARLETAITGGLDKAIDELAVTLAGGDRKRARAGFRSKAARLLLARGVRAMEAEKVPAQ